MADVRLQARVVPNSNTADSDSYKPARALRDGGQVAHLTLEALAQEGRIFGANMGSVTTPLTFLITAANRPDAWIRVPSGTSILPIKVNYVLETLAGTANEIDVRSAANDIGNGTSTAATVGPQALRTDAPIVSACTARQLATADTTAETSPMSLVRKTINTAGAAGNDDAASFVFTREMMGYPLLVGPATLEVFIAATTTQATGFVVITWAEIPTTRFS